MLAPHHSTRSGESAHTEADAFSCMHQAACMKLNCSNSNKVQAQRSVREHTHAAPQ
jgi:hypothetical protein